LDEVPVLVGTLGKAFGTAGAFIAGSEELIETLIQFARSYIYTTSQPPAVAWATLTSLRLAREESWRREHLARLIERFRAGAAQLGLQLMDSPTPIQPILVGDSARALRLSEGLRQRGILVTAIRPPTVPQGTARLRVTLSAAHAETDVDRLLDALQQTLADHPIARLGNGHRYHGAPARSAAGVAAGGAGGHRTAAGHPAVQSGNRPELPGPTYRAGRSGRLVPGRDAGSAAEPALPRTFPCGSHPGQQCLLRRAS